MWDQRDSLEDPDPDVGVTLLLIWSSSTATDGGIQTDSVK